MTDLNPKDAIKAALSAQNSGDYTAAIDLYLRALAIDGDDPNALTLLGAALVFAGRASEAETPLKRAVELAPKEPIVHTNLAHFHFATDQLDLAVDELKKALALYPDYTPALTLLGETHISKKEFEQAADALDKALQLDSGNLKLALRLSRALAAAGKFPESLGVLEHADKITPDALQTVALRTEIARIRNDWGALEKAAEKLTKLSPNDPRGWRELAFGYFETGRYRGAMQAFEQILKRGERTAENLGLFGALALHAGRVTEAGAALDEAEALGADSPEFLTAQALRRIQDGQLAEAEQYCLRALARNPRHIPAYPPLSALRGGRLQPEEQATLSAVVSDAATPLSARSTASFALAHSFDSDGDIDTAFAEYRRANDLARSDRQANRVGYNPADTERRISAVFDRFSDPGLYSASSGPDKEGRPTPIFILGAPRSGTTLVETVIGAHSKVAIGGELPMMISLLNEFLARGDYAGPLSEKEREAFVQAYWREAPPTNGASFMTDKGMLCMDAAGLMAQLFPQSPIIYVRRNPLEAGLSIFRYEFTKFFAFTDSLDNIGHYLGQSERMAARWAQILGDRITSVQHETFVEDFDNEARRLIAACGLDWEDACATRGGAGKTALTISAVQVREPIELRAGRARAYGEHLGPLKSALKEANIDLETGAWRG